MGKKAKEFADRAELPCVRGCGRRGLGGAGCDYSVTDGVPDVLLDCLSLSSVWRCFMRHLLITLYPKQNLKQLLLGLTGTLGGCQASSFFLFPMGALRGSSKASFLLLQELPDPQIQSW